jgi:hypothetical protein
LRTLYTVILVLALSASASCGKGSPTSPSDPITPATIVGTWRATKAEFYSRQNSSLRVDAIGQGRKIGVVFESSTCTWTFEYEFPGQPTLVRTGNWKLESIDGEQHLRVTWTSGEPRGDILYKNSLSGNLLTLTHTSGEYYDYTGNGPSAEDDSGLILTLARQGS